MISIITATYNRAHLLKHAYKSLLKQTNKDFEWIVVDDGSIDNTKEIVDNFNKEKKIEIKYFFKKNGGRHSAINFGVKKSKGDYILLLDSDDFLTDDCIEKISNYIPKYDKNKKIADLCFLKIHNNNQVIGNTYEGTEIISNNIDFRYNQNHLGDMAEVFKRNILLKYPFPEYKNEKFLSEAIIWNGIALKYDTVYINEPICICEYLDGGLSSNVFLTRAKNPFGAYNNSKLFLIKRFKLSIRIKNSILYTGYYLMAHKSNKNLLKDVESKILVIINYLFGFILYLYLKSILKKATK